LTTVDKTYTTVVPVVTPTRSVNSPAEGSEACEVPATVTSTIITGTSTTTVYPKTTTTVYIDEDEEEPTKIPGSTRKTSTSYTTTTIPTTSTGIATYEKPHGISTVTVTPIQTITISTKIKGIPAEASTYYPDTTTTEYMAIPADATPSTYPSTPSTYLSTPSKYPSGYPGTPAGNDTTPYYPVESVPVYTGAASRQTVGLGLLSVVVAGVLGVAALL